MNRLRPAMGARRGSLGRFVLGADNHAAAAGHSNVVPHRGGEIERRNAMGRANLNDPARIARTAELIAEFGLVVLSSSRHSAGGTVWGWPLLHYGIVWVTGGEPRP
jgi:hypothetical protein